MTAKSLCVTLLKLVHESYIHILQTLVIRTCEPQFIFIQTHKRTQDSSTSCYDLELRFAGNRPKRYYLEKPELCNFIKIYLLTRT
jgi:hypothetical protein